VPHVLKQSGFTAIALQTHHYPSVIDNQSQVPFVVNKAVGNTTQLLPNYSLTKEALADMAEL
jgi:dihydroorotase